MVYAVAEDPSFRQRSRLDGIRAVLSALPDLEDKVLAVRQRRARGVTGFIDATNVYPEESEKILESGCITTYHYCRETQVGTR